jgi:hypothetical protein
MERLYHGIWKHRTLKKQPLITRLPITGSVNLQLQFYLNKEERAEISALLIHSNYNFSFS